MKRRTVIKRILRRDGAVARYCRARIAEAVFKAAAATGKPDRRLAETVARKVEVALTRTYAGDALPSVEDIQDIVENTLMESGQPQLARNYIIYRHQRAQLRAARAQPFEMSDIIPYRKIYEVLLWNINHKCDSAQALNRTIAKGRFPKLVAAAEQRYQEEVEQAAHLILDRTDPARMVLIAGPSSSGKTTTTIRLGEILRKHGIGLKAMCIDNYFFDLDLHPRDEFGDYDYETPRALDLRLINRHLEQLLAGKKIKTPQYDFKTGKRTLNAREMRLQKNELLLIDSLHGLHKGMTRSVPDECKIRLYVETLGQLRLNDGAFMRWADNRLLRRMIRDSRQRNSTPLQTLTHWHYVRTSELSHIIPFINTADFVVNTALPYELPILKNKLYRHFAKALREFADDPARRDAYIRAKRVMEMLRQVKTVKDSSCVPTTSLFREFLGGSAYTY